MTYWPCAGCPSRYAYVGDWAGRVYCVRLTCTYRCLMMRVGAETGFHAPGTIGVGETIWRTFVTAATIEELIEAWYAVPIEIRREVDDIDRTRLDEMQEKVKV